MILQIQSKCYKRRLRRKIEKERQKKIRRNEIKRIVTQVQKSFGDESSELDENLNKNSDESLESEIFCEQSQETVIAIDFYVTKSRNCDSNRFLCNKIEHAREHSKKSHDSEYEMNNDNFVADSEEELDEWSSSDNNTDSNNEQSESTRDNDVFQFPNNEAKECMLQKQSVSGHWRGEFSP